jgi:heavy metal sensor kinase
MFRSIRSRLQVWYALVLLAVVAGFASFLYYRVREARLGAIDTHLQADAHYLDVNLRRFPRHEFEDAPDEHPPPPFPLRPPREWLMAELTLPNPADLETGSWFVVRRLDGSVLKAAGLPEGTVPLEEVSPERLPRLYWRGDNREAAMLGPLHTHILVGRSVAPELAELNAFLWQLVVSGAAVLGLGLVGGWFLSARVVRPLAAFSATAAAISAEDLSRRIDTNAVERELTELGTVLNAMFDRLQAAFERQTRFTADASHELRTPLAILRSHAELALNRPRSEAEYRQTLEAMLQAATRMTALVEGLLTLARADAAELELARRRFDLGEVVAESVALLRPLAASKEVTVTTGLEPVEVTGDPLHLGMVATNLLSNAIQYNRPGGSVRVALTTEGDAAVLEVADTGRGIPPEDQPHLFERFHRVDKARARATGGHGLGLAICRSIVAVHGGSITFTTTPGTGTTFLVRVPM